jgi:hypothetical protein
MIANIDIHQVIAYLKTITNLGGNLPDERLTDRTGPNDAAQRGLMYCGARRLAKECLTKMGVE